MRKMILLLFVLVSGTAAYAQYTPTWYFAYRPEGGRLIAYLPSGEENVLIESGVHLLGGGWRLNDGSALAGLTVDDEPGLYHLRGESYTRLEWTGAGDFAVIDLIGPLIHQNGTQAVIQNYYDPFANELVLIDTETGTFDIIDSQTILTVRVSNDDSALRYVRYDGEETWTLREYKFATGDVRDLYTFNERYPYMSADRQGERWLYMQADSREFVMISIDGSVETIAPLSAENPISYRLFEEGLISYPLDCEADCTLEWDILEQALSYPLPSPLDGVVSPVVGLEDFDLIVTIDSTYWRLMPDEAPLYLGAWSPQTVFTPPIDVVSPGFQSLLTLEDEDTDPVRYTVRDLHSNEIIHSDEGAFLMINYWRNGFILNDLRDEQTFVYLRSRDEVIELPNEPSGMFFELLPDDTLLFLLGPENDERGIIRYEPVSETFTLVVENAVPINLRPQRPPR